MLVGSRPDLGVGEFVELFLEHPERFEDFDPDITYRWIETHLLDLVNRGPTQAVAGLDHCTDSLTGSACRRSRPYGADEQLYWMIYHASGDRANHDPGRPKRFFFAEVDALQRHRSAPATRST